MNRRRLPTADGGAPAPGDACSPTFAGFASLNSGLLPPRRARREARSTRGCDHSRLRPFTSRSTPASTRRFAAFGFSSRCQGEARHRVASGFACIPERVHRLIRVNRADRVIQPRSSRRRNSARGFSCTSAFLA